MKAKKIKYTILLVFLLASSGAMAFGFRLQTCVQANMYGQIFWVGTYISNSTGQIVQEFYPVNQYPYCPQSL